MFKKFLLVTTALVAVHASNPFDEAVAAYVELGQSLPKLKAVLTAKEREIRSQGMMIQDLTEDLEKAKLLGANATKLQLELGIMRGERDDFKSQHEKEADAHTITTRDRADSHDRHVNDFGLLDTQFQQASSDLNDAKLAVSRLEGELKLAQDGGLSTATNLQQQLEAAQKLADDKQLELTAMESQRDALQEKLGDAEALLESSKDELRPMLPYGGEEFYQSSLANIIEAVKKIVVNEQSLGMLTGMLPGGMQEEA